MFNYDYSKTMMMKILLAKPNFKGGSFVWYNFEQTLEIIKQIDIITLGAPKIIYLVGWQYFGHDDKYPAFFEVNEILKREQDKSSRDSLLWLINEAKKYNTIVSLHINLSDAYQDSPLWQEYINNDLILRKNNGQLKVTGKWYGRNAYQVRFKEEFESGYFKKRVDKLLELLPIKDAKTIHVDAFFVRKGKNNSIEDEKKARKKMIEYFADNGIDVTSEFIYREKKNGFRSHVGESDVIGIIPAFWQVVLSQKDIMKFSAQEIGGGRQCRSLARDKKLEWLFYGNIFGEDIFKIGIDWQEKFIKEFATYNLPYLYLNCHQRKSITGHCNSRVCHYTEGIDACIKNKKIIDNGNILKENNNLCLPIFWKKDWYIAFSENGGQKNWYVKGLKTRIFELNNNGLQLLADNIITKKSYKKEENYDGKENYMLSFNTKPNCAYAIEIIDFK